MDLSFYSAVSGARAQQSHLDAIANNVANVNNAGYRAQDTTFANLIYQNFRAGSTLQQGSGTMTQRTNFDFGGAAYLMTDGALDFAIEGEGFFAVQNTATGATYYTRSGNFILSEGVDGQFYLATPTGERVLDTRGNQIVMASADTQPDIGVFRFNHTEGFRAMGNNLYAPGATNGGPILNPAATLRTGTLEGSNVDLTSQFSGMIETQRLYQLSLRMLQTADEIEGTINNFR